MTSVVERIATTIAPHISEAFALMGNGNAYLLDAISRLTDVHLTTVRHEVATVASADAYTRITRQLALASVTYGAGFTNTLTALADARMQRTPMLVVAGAPRTTGRKPWDVDQTALAAALGVPTIEVTAEAPGAATLAAMRLAVADRTPVVLALPYDLPTASTDEPEVWAPTLAVERLQADAQAVERVAERLRSARRPLILAGRGALQARAELRDLADELGALSVASAPTRGFFEGRALPLDLGVAGGFSSETTLAHTRSADVVLVVGASLNQFTMAFGNLLGAEAHVVQIDVLDEATHARVDEYVRADAVDAVQALLGAVSGRSSSVAVDSWAGINRDEIGGAHFDRPLGAEFADDGRLDPRGLATTLNGMLPADRHFASDGGHFIGWASTHFSVPRPDSVTMVGTAFQSIGLGFPSAPGAARARPESLLVVPTGDGGGLMGIADLDSLVRAARSAVVVVYNDAAYNAEVQQYGRQGLDQAPMLIDEVDFSQIAKGVGAASSIIRSWADLAPFEDWLRAGAHGTFLLDCRISREIVAPYQVEILDEVFGLDVEAMGLREAIRA